MGDIKCLLHLWTEKKQQMSEGYNPHPSLYGVCEQQTSRSVDLLILLLNVARYLLQNLKREYKRWENMKGCL